MLRRTGSNGETPLNGNAAKRRQEGQEGQEGQETATDTSIQEDLFLLFLLFLPSLSSVAVEQKRSRPKRTSSPREHQRRGVTLRPGVFAFFLFRVLNTFSAILSHVQAFSIQFT